MNEAYLKRKIMKWLKENITDGYFFTYNPARYGHAGISDILGCYRGIFIAIEVKIGKNKITNLQKNFLQTVINKRGIAFVARSLEDVISIFNFLKLQEDMIVEKFKKQIKLN